MLKNIKSEQLTSDVFEGSVDARRNKIMLRLMIASKRYQDIVIKNVKRVFSKENINQFLAYTAVLPNKSLFIHIPDCKSIDDYKTHASKIEQIINILKFLVIDNFKSFFKLIVLILFLVS